MGSAPVVLIPEAPFILLRIATKSGRMYAYGSRALQNRTFFNTEPFMQCSESPWIHTLSYLRRRSTHLLENKIPTFPRSTLTSNYSPNLEWPLKYNRSLPLSSHSPSDGSYARAMCWSWGLSSMWKLSTPLRLPGTQRRTLQIDTRNSLRTGRRSAEKLCTGPAMGSPVQISTTSPDTTQKPESPTKVSCLECITLEPNLTIPQVGPVNRNCFRTLSLSKRPSYWSRSRRRSTAPTLTEGLVSNPLYCGAPIINGEVQLSHSLLTKRSSTAIINGHLGPASWLFTTVEQTISGRSVFNKDMFPLIRICVNANIIGAIQDGHWRT